MASGVAGKILGPTTGVGAALTPRVRMATDARVGEVLAVRRIVVDVLRADEGQLARRGSTYGFRSMLVRMGPT